MKASVPAFSLLIGAVIGDVSGAAAQAQSQRTIPMGNPLDPATPVEPDSQRIEILPTPADDPAMQAQRQRVARARAMAAQRQVDTLYAQRNPQEPPEERRTQPSLPSVQDEPQGRNAGPLPTPFSGGITVPWNSGIRSTWGR